MPFKGGTAELLLLDLKYRVTYTRPFHPKLKAANPREK
jgi:hypothetical protein